MFSYLSRLSTSFQFSTKIEAFIDAAIAHLPNPALGVTKVHLYRGALMGLIIVFFFGAALPTVSLLLPLKDALVISATLTMLAAYLLLSNKYSKYSLEIGAVYICFFILTVLFVNTDSIVNFFIIYELFLLPSAALVYFFSPNKRGTKTTVYFLLWTQAGSFLVLLGVVLMYWDSKSVSFLHLTHVNYTIPAPIALLIVFGFLVKVPTFPFFYWLAKTHVEAITSFSIFLSGFLVKLAVFGLYKFLPLLPTSVVSLAEVLSLLSFVLATVLFTYQVDFKKLIAYATIQEMSLILLFLLITAGTKNHTVGLFLVTHTVLSALMFTLNDFVYKRYNTRNFNALRGVGTAIPKFAMFIYTALLLFKGFPLTLKFIAEVNIIEHVFFSTNYTLLSLTVITILVGNVAISYKMLTLLFGLHQHNQTYFGLSQLETLTLVIFTLVLATLQLYL